MAGRKHRWHLWASRKYSLLNQVRARCQCKVRRSELLSGLNWIRRCWILLLRAKQKTSLLQSRKSSRRNQSRKRWRLSSLSQWRHHRCLKLQVRSRRTSSQKLRLMEMKSLHAPLKQYLARWLLIRGLRCSLRSKASKPCLLWKTSLPLLSQRLSNLIKRSRI